MEVTGKKVLVFGSGISGIGAVKLLEDHGAEVILYDGNDKLDKVAMKEQLGDGVKAEIILGEFPEKLIDTLDIAVLSPGVPTDLPVVNAMRDKKVAVIGEVELAYAFGKGDGCVKKIYCVKNSAAYKYAKKNNIPYKTVSIKE